MVGDAEKILNNHDLSEEEQEKLNREYSTLFEVVKRDDRLNEIAQHIQDIRDKAKQLNIEAVQDLENAKLEVEKMILRQ